MLAQICPAFVRIHHLAVFFWIQASYFIFPKNSSVDSHAVWCTLFQQLLSSLNFHPVLVWFGWICCERWSNLLVSCQGINFIFCFDWGRGVIDSRDEQPSFCVVRLVPFPEKFQNGNLKVFLKLSSNCALLKQFMNNSIETSQRALVFFGKEFQPQKLRENL